MCVCVCVCVCTPHCARRRRSLLSSPSLAKTILVCPFFLHPLTLLSHFFPHKHGSWRGKGRNRGYRKKTRFFLPPPSLSFPPFHDHAMTSPRLPSRKKRPSVRRLRQSLAEKSNECSKLQTELAECKCELALALEQLVRAGLEFHPAASSRTRASVADLSSSYGHANHVPPHVPLPVPLPVPPHVPPRDDNHNHVCVEFDAHSSTFPHAVRRISHSHDSSSPIAHVETRSRISFVFRVMGNDSHPFRSTSERPLRFRLGLSFDDTGEDVGLDDVCGYRLTSISDPAVLGAEHSPSSDGLVVVGPFRLKVLSSHVSNRKMRFVLTCTSHPMRPVSTDPFVAVARLRAVEEESQNR